MAAAEVAVTTSLVNSLNSDHFRSQTFYPTASDVDALSSPNDKSLSDEKSSSSLFQAELVKNLSVCIKTAFFFLDSENVTEDFVKQRALDMKNRGLTVNSIDLYIECNNYFSSNSSHEKDLFKREASDGQPILTSLPSAHRNVNSSPASHHSVECSALPSPHHSVECSALPSPHHHLENSSSFLSNSNISSSGLRCGNTFQGFPSLSGFDTCMVTQSGQNSAFVNTCQIIQSSHNSASVNTSEVTQSGNYSTPADIEEDSVDGCLLSTARNTEHDDLEDGSLDHLVPKHVAPSVDNLELNHVSSFALPESTVSYEHNITNSYMLSEDASISSQPNDTVDEKFNDLTSSRSSTLCLEALKGTDSLDKTRPYLYNLQNLTDFQDFDCKNPGSDTFKEISRYFVVDGEEVKTVTESKMDSDRKFSPVQEERFVNICFKLLETENVLLKKSRLCSICFLQPREITFLPCGHFTTCRNCAEPIYKCHECNTSILGILNTYLS